MLPNYSLQFATVIMEYEEYELNLNNEIIQRVVNILVSIFSAIMSIFVFIGNSLMVIIMFKENTIRSNVNNLIINFAITDLLFVIFCTPFMATDFVMPNWPFGNTWCKMVQYLIIVTAFTSIYILVLMSFN